MAKKIAVIDLGTNTFNLLIASVEEKSFESIFHDKLGVALGMGGINKNILSEDAIQRALQALYVFKQKCEEYEVFEIRAYGTSAIRNAKNGIDFCNVVQKQLNIDIKIISGLEEAQLIYQGVKWSYDFKQPAIIMDIGGGSTEFIMANQKKVLKAMSLDIGVSRIHQQFELNDPISNSDSIKIENWLESNSLTQLDNLSCDTLIGSSGTFETLHELYYKEKFPDTKECIYMGVKDLQSILQLIIESTLKERQENRFILPIRQVMLPIAAVKINWIIRKFGVKQLMISPYSLKEGALMEN